MYVPRRWVCLFESLLLFYGILHTRKKLTAKLRNSINKLYVCLGFTRYFIYLTSMIYCRPHHQLTSGSCGQARLYFRIRKKATHLTITLQSCLIYSATVSESLPYTRLGNKRKPSDNFILLTSAMA